jgi:hypothetical protein
MQCAAQNAANPGSLTYQRFKPAHPQQHGDVDNNSTFAWYGKVMVLPSHSAASPVRVPSQPLHSSDVAVVRKQQPRLPQLSQRSSVHTN